MRLDAVHIPLERSNSGENSIKCKNPQECAPFPAGLFLAGGGGGGDRRGGKEGPVGLGSRARGVGVGGGGGGGGGI